MASKKKELRSAYQDGKIGKKETGNLTAAGVTPERLQNFQTKREVISNIGKRFGENDFKALQDSGFSNNKVLKVAASSRKVNANASNKLTGLNPGIKLPSQDRNDGLLGGTLEPINRMYGGLDTLGIRTQLGKQVQGLGKKYLQWQGTDTKGRPQALRGFNVPGRMRRGDPMMAGQRAIQRGTFTAANGSGTLFGRDGSSVLKNSGKMKNSPASWLPGKGGIGGAGGEGGKKDGGKKVKGEGGEAPGFGEEAASSTGGLSGVFGGTGTETYGSPTFRRKRSRAQRSGSFTQGPSRLGINLQRQSGLNIMRA